MDRDTTFKEHHFWELQRRETLNSNVSFLVGVATILIGATYTMAKDIDSRCNFADSLFVLGLATTTAVLLASVYFILRAYTGYRYAHSPDTVGLMKTKKDLIEYFKKEGHPEDVAEKKATCDFFQQIDDSYAEQASVNKKCNDKKAKWIYRANKAISSGLASIAITGVAFLLR